MIDKVNYDGMELELLKCNEHTFFKPYKRCISVSISADGKSYRLGKIVDIMAFIHGREFPYISKDNAFENVAFIEDCKLPRRVSWRELAFWLIDGNGLVKDTETGRVDTGVFFDEKNLNEEVGERWQIMRRNDNEWREANVENMEITEE